MIHMKFGKQLPINGPKAVTNSALPTICQPKAAGNFSSEQYSDTVNVKLLSAEPRKKPHIDSQTMSSVQPVCSAITIYKRVRDTDI